VTNPELEAAIEQDPDDEGAYLVYADWLQGQGDPRGELIVLHAAAQRDPADKKLAQAAERHLKKHADVLIGELGSTRRVTLGWHLGFVRDARFAIGADGKPGTGDLDALRALLAHPAGRFVQTIAIARPIGFSAADVVQLLLAERKPTTLADLQIGRSWDHGTEAPELREVFPRLTNALDVEWKRIERVLAKQRKAALVYDAEKFPALVRRPLDDDAADDGDGDGDGDGAPITDPAKLLLGLKLELGRQPDLGIVAAIKRSFTPESLDAFAVVLGEQFRAKGEGAAIKWGFQAIGLLGGPRAIEWLARQVRDWSHARAVQCVDLLRQIGSGLAIWEIYGIALDTSLMRARRDDTAQRLEWTATNRKLELDVLLDRSLPPLGLREVRVRDAQIRRLHDHMIDGRRLGSAHFLRHFATHPRMAPGTQRVVWATYERGDVEATFRIDDSGLPRDVAGGEVDLDGATIGILHPVELAPDDRAEVLAGWAAAFRRADVTPLFEQLDRPVHQLREQERGTEITRFKLRGVGFDRLRTMFETELDWSPVREDTDGGAITIGWERVFRRDNATATAWLAEGNGAIDSVELTRNGREASFGNLHPVTASEILYALDRATTRERAAVRDATPEPAASPITRGARVKITRGAGRLREGVVFWVGDGNNGPRCGLKTDNDETLWADVADVRLDAPAPEPTGEITARPRGTAEPGDAKPRKAKAKAKPAAEPATAGPAFAKGSKVRWTRGRNTGTGVAFWIGKNKFGDGMRVGVKDDETGETVWADANDCAPVTGS